MNSGKLIACILLLLTVINAVKGKDAEQSFSETFSWTDWSELPAVPGSSYQPGLAGVFSGISGSYLIVAGGANFPEAPPWEGGTKTWWDHVYAVHLDSIEAGWKVYEEAFTHPLAYGVSISIPGGILCIGGCDSRNTYSDVFLMRFSGSSFEYDQWPALPVSLSNMTGCRVDDRIYIAGGQEGMEEPSATSHFLALDLNDPSAGWKEVDSWPGPPRAYAVSAAQSDGFDNCFYLFSGRNFGPGTDLEVLSDAYEYNPRLNEWRKLDRPEGPQFPVMAGMASSSGANHIIFFGGVESTMPMKEQQLKKKLQLLQEGPEIPGRADSIRAVEAAIQTLLEGHPGFSREIRFYHTITNTLVTHSSSPFPIPVTTTLVRDEDRYYITSGELRPGIRTPKILTIDTVSQTRSIGTLNIVVIILYFALLVFMGWYFSKRQKSSTDYFKAGGRIPWWAVGLSIFGTALSAITFMAIPAKAYATDWSYMLMNAGIILVAPLIIFLFIPFYRRLNITTAYEYLEQRFNLTTRLICSISFILFQVGRMGVVLLLPSIALHVVTGIDIFLCISLMGVLSLVYTMMGGIEAVVWTDALQVVILLGGAIFAVFYIGMDVEGGIREVIAEGMADNKFAMASTELDLKNPTLVTVLLATLFANITTYGTDQTMVQRYLTTRDEKMAGRSVWTNAVLTVPATLIFFFVGTCLYVFFKANPALLSSTVSDGDAIFPWFIYTQMPPGLSGLLISGIFAAAMSTLSSSMNSAATAYSVDIHFRFGWSGKRDKLWLARLFTLIIGLSGILFAILMATWDIKSLWDEFQKILGLILGGLGGLFLLGLLTRRANGPGAVIGLIGSIVVQFWVSKTGMVHLLLYAGTGFVSCFLIGYMASLLFPGRPDDITQLTIYGIRTKKNK
jgi:cyclically-permuted mutarotase family protein